MENWALEKISDKIYNFGKITKEKIKNLELVYDENARYVDLFPAIEGHKKLISITCSSEYTTVEYDEYKQIGSVKVWFKKDEVELLVVKELKEEYDSSKEMWGFYDLIYKDDFSEIENIEAIQKKENGRYYKEFDGITFGGEVDFNLKNSKVNYLKKTVKNDPLFSDNKEKSEEEKLKKEILDLIEATSNYHHSVENVVV